MIPDVSSSSSSSKKNAWILFGVDSFEYVNVSIGTVYTGTFTVDMNGMEMCATVDMLTFSVRTCLFNVHGRSLQCRRFSERLISFKGKRGWGYGQRLVREHRSVHSC